MKTDLKPTDPEYIEALANDLCPNTTHTNFERYQLRLGYQLALSHTNHDEIVEAAKLCISAKTTDQIRDCLFNLKQQLTKSETSKL